MMGGPAMEGVVVNALRSVMQRVRHAADIAGREHSRVRVVAVSKTKPISLIRQLYDAGHRSFGENYVQEFLDKAPQLPEDIEWHFIGHLQTNKVKSLLASVPHLAMVEGVDSAKLASHLDRAVSTIGRKPLKVLVQVNTSGETTKSGVEPPACLDLVKHVKLACPNLEFSGLMTIGMPDYTSTPENFQGPSEFTSSSTPIVDIETGLLGHQVSNLGRRVWKHAIFRIMFIVPMLMLVLVACYGYKLTTSMTYTKINSFEDRYIAFLFGIVTLIFGMIYFILGLTMVAELVLDLLAWLRHEDSKTSEDEEKEHTTKCEMLVNTLAIIVSMFMLTKAIFYGYELAVEAQEVVIYSRLPFLIGAVSMGFVFIYFICRMGLLAESGFRLSSRLHQVVTKSDALLDRQTEVNKV